jgi:hypothetical protein
MSLKNPGIYVPGQGDGQLGHLTLPGSGIAIPGGLECMFEYNGLYMNIKKNVDRYRITNIDGLGDADIRDTREVNTDSDGETPYNSFYGGRTIVITGVIDTYTIPKLRDMQFALRQAFADISKEMPLIFRTGNFTNDHKIYCKKIGSNAMVETQASVSARRDFQISLRASNPRFLSFYEKFLDVSLDGTFHSTPTFLGNVHNAGNYKASPVFRIYGPSVGGITIINDSTSQKFSIARIPGGEYYEYNLGAPPRNTKYLIDQDGSNVWNMLSDDSVFVDLAPGDNNLFIIGDATRVRTSWNHSYL